VSDDSPVFKLLAETTETVKRRRFRNPSSTELSNILKTTSFELQRSFGENASPTDIDKNGKGIFMVFHLSTPSIHVADYTGRS
jgi:hypothetical protein